MENIHIQEAGITDLDLIREIASSTFYETFAESNSQEDLQHYLDYNLSREKLKTEIENKSSWFFLALQNDKCLGYLKLNSEDAQTEKQENGIEIERIYVASEFQGMKIGQLLLQKAFEVAASQSAEFIWLGVWQENTKAIGFYERNNFAAFGKHEFVLGNDIQTDILMKRFLRSDEL